MPRLIIIEVPSQMPPNPMRLRRRRPIICGATTLCVEGFQLHELVPPSGRGWCLQLLPLKLILVESAQPARDQLSLLFPLVSLAAGACVRVWFGHPAHEIGF